VHFFDTHGLTGKDLAEIDFLLPRQMRPQRDHDRLIVERIVDVRQSGVGARGRLVDLRRTFHVESFVGTLVVEDLGKFVKACLLLQKIGGDGFGRFFFQGQMHAFVTAVLLGMTGLDAFNEGSDLAAYSAGSCVGVLSFDGVR
jgi:hypothetical protein